MAEPFAIPNEVQGTLKAGEPFHFHSGGDTDDHLHLTAIGLFDAGGGHIRVKTTDGVHWCLLTYTVVEDTNDLHGLTQTGLTGLLYSDAVYDFPAASIVERAQMGEDVSKRIMGPASATNGHFFKADGTSGKLAKAEAIAATEIPFALTVTQAATTFYVAKTGNDADGLAYGGTAAHPFLTISAAILALPNVIAHSSYINVSPGTYTETLTVALATKIISATFTIRAVDTAGRSWYANGTVVAGAATTVDLEAAHVLADDEWNGGYIQLYDGAGEEGQVRAITDTDNTNNRLTVATWETNPAAGAKYAIGGMVKIDGNDTTPIALNHIQNLRLYGIEVLTSGSTTQYALNINVLSHIYISHCFTVSQWGLLLTGGSIGALWYCGGLVADNGYGMIVNSGSVAYSVYSVMYGAAKAGEVGMYASMNGSINSDVKLIARHCGLGIKADTGGWVVGATTYIDNTVSASPATFAVHVGADGAYISDVT